MVQLPKALQTYAVDFEHSEEQILQFVFRYVDAEYDILTVLDMVKSKQVLLKYEWKVILKNQIFNNIY